MTISGTTITSPNHPNDYRNNQDCRTVIRFAQGQKVYLRFLAFNLEPHPRCNSDWLEIRDGDNENANLIGRKYCGSESSSILSTRNALFIYFHTDSFFGTSGFKIKVEAIGKSCCKQNIIFFRYHIKKHELLTICCIKYVLFFF